VTAATNQQFAVVGTQVSISASDPTVTSGTAMLTDANGCLNPNPQYQTFDPTYDLSWSVSGNVNPNPSQGTGSTASFTVQMAGTATVTFTGSANSTSSPPWGLAWSGTAITTSTTVAFADIDVASSQNDGISIHDSSLASICVGEQITLSIDNPPPGAAFQWNLPADAIASYNPSSTNASATQLDAGDEDGESVTFYLIKGNTDQVSCTMTIAGNTLTASGTLNVVAPTNVIFTTVSDPAVQNGDHQMDYSLEFTHSASAPSGFNGAFVWTQVLNTYQAYNNTTKLVSTSNSCDSGFPYNSTNHDSDDPTVGYTFTTDSPTTATFSATLYLMFLPQIANAIYVPVSSVNWWWYGTVTYNGPAVGPGSFTDPKDWPLSNTSTSPTDPTPTQTFTEPIWTNEYHH